MASHRSTRARRRRRRRRCPDRRQRRQALEHARRAPAGRGNAAVSRAVLARQKRSKGTQKEGLNSAEDKA